MSKSENTVSAIVFYFTLSLIMLSWSVQRLYTLVLKTWREATCCAWRISIFILFSSKWFLQCHHHLFSSLVSFIYLCHQTLDLLHQIFLCHTMFLSLPCPLCVSLPNKKCSTWREGLVNPMDITFSAVSGHKSPLMQRTSQHT